MKKSTILKLSFISILFISSQSIAQSTEQIQFNKNNVYVDGALGVFSQASINYERQIHSGERVGWYGRIGAYSGYEAYGWATGEGSRGGVGAITMLIRSKKWNGELRKLQMEFNAGVFVGKGESGTFIYPLLTFGGRYQPLESGFILRSYFGTGIGISVGYAF